MPWLSFNRHRQGRKAFGLAAPVLPAGFGVLKPKLGHDLAGSVDDDDVMLLLGPIETGEVGEGGFRGQGGLSGAGFGRRFLQPLPWLQS